MSDSDDEDVCVTVRPYSDDGAASARRLVRPMERRARTVQPRPPPERRAVKKSVWSSECREETIASVLQAARRTQEAEGARAGFAPALVPERFRGMSLSKFGVHARSAVASAGASGGPSAPRKAKEWKEGRSTELMDLAFSDSRRGPDGLARKHYTPISLPYFAVDAEGGDEGEAGAGSGTKKSRPTMKHVDEANTNAARELFLSPEGALQEDQLLLLQLPSVLPELADPTEEVQREGEDPKSAATSASILRYPDGKLGKLKIHKSGKVRMEIGGVPFCVDQGSATFFHQEVACICPLAEEMVNLGSIDNRVILTPDLDAMFADMERETASKEAKDAKEAEAKLAVSGDAG